MTADRAIRRRNFDLRIFCRIEGQRTIGNALKNLCVNIFARICKQSCCDIGGVSYQIGLCNFDQFWVGGNREHGVGENV